MGALRRGDQRELQPNFSLLRVFLKRKMVLELGGCLLNIKHCSHLTHIISLGLKLRMHLTPIPSNKASPSIQNEIHAAPHRNAFLLHPSVMMEQLDLHQYSPTVGQPQHLLSRKEIFSLSHCLSPPGRGVHSPAPPLQDKPVSWTANYSSVRCSVWIMSLHTVPSVISSGVVQCRQLFPILTSHLFRMSVLRWELGLHVSDPREGLGVHPRSRPLFGLHIVQRVNTPAGLYT